MKFEDARRHAHVRSAIYNPKISNKKYWKNHVIPLEKQVPVEHQQIDGWLEYDPREDDDCSLSAFND